MTSPRHARRRPVPGWAIVAGVALVAAAAATLGFTRASTPPPTTPVASRTASPSATAVPTPAPEPTDEPEARGTLLIRATGDVGLTPTPIPALRYHGYDWAWSGLNGFFLKDDLTIINHECPSTRRVAPIEKQYNFRCDPDALKAARKAGVEVLNLGNNHAYDQGPLGVVDSLKNIRAAGLTPVGAGRNTEEAERPALFELNGWKVAVLGFGEVLDPLYQTAGPNKPGTATGHSLDRKVRAIQRADKVADVVLVTIHWGVELDTEPRDYQIQEGRAMIDAGADAIFGHHSHRLQPLTWYKHRPIFWGLGNFVWPHFGGLSSQTGIAQVRISPEGEFSARIVPAHIESSGHPVLT